MLDRLAGPLIFEKKIVEMKLNEEIIFGKRSVSKDFYLNSLNKGVQSHPLLCGTNTMLDENV